MTVGTKSSLFGTHQFFYHPITVALAWRRLYGQWPRWREWVAILLHDNYFGLPNMDGPEGKTHPARNAALARWIAGPYAEELVRFHSRAFAQAAERNPSALCAPDKMSILYDPKWFYILRARASGEIWEYIKNAVSSGHVSADTTPSEWYDFYKGKVMNEFQKAIYLPLKPGLYAVVDVDCPEWILKQKWSANEKTPGRPYAYRSYTGEKKTHQMLHHVILDKAPGTGEVDHINGNTLDNRRANLRWCMHPENGRNLQKWKSITSSKYKGVSFHKQSGRWRAYIVLGGIQRDLGRFVVEQDAARAYNNEAKKLFGDYARLNEIEK